MSRAKGQHSVDRRRAPYGRTRNGLLAHNQAKGGNGHRLEHSADNVKNAFRRERPKQSGNIHRDVDSGDDEVEASRDFLQCTIAFRVVDVVCAEFPCLGLLTIGSGEGVDFATPFVSKL